MTRALTTAQLRARAKRLAGRFGERSHVFAVERSGGTWYSIANYALGNTRQHIADADGPTEHAALAELVRALERELVARVRADQRALGGEG